MFRRIYRITSSLAPKQTFRSFSITRPVYIDSMKIDDNFDPKALEEQIANIKAKIEDDKQKEALSEDKNEELKKAEFTSAEISGEFKAETSKLLNIVAESLYSDSQVFIREFVANASDAIEKARLEYSADREFLIQVRTDKANNTITFVDNGVGMNKDDVIELLGTIAKSGSKQYTLDAADTESDKADNIIGQFGVGFYSSFMVGSKVEVYTRKTGENEDGTGIYWVSDGISSYQTREISNCDEGTRIVIHLKGNHRDYADPAKVKDILEKNSNFSRHQIRLNGHDLEMKKPIWNLTQRELDDEQHEKFYQFLIGANSGKPRWTLHYTTDSPLSIKSIFYCPEGRPSMQEVQKTDNESEGRSNIALYSKNVLIQKNSVLVPRWLRFMRGVVDCEDIPLNLSRELLQDQALIKKLQSTITNRLIKLFLDKAKRRPEEYLEFFNDYKMYIVQGVLEEENVTVREERCKLLRYESSNFPRGQCTSLDDYRKRMNADQQFIVYLLANNRSQAENSSYYESLKKKGYEVLFCYDSYDDLTMMNLGVYDGKQIQSAEGVTMALSQDTSDESGNFDIDITSENYIKVDDMASWATNEMAGEIEGVEVAKNLDKQPAMITSWNLSMARYMIRSQRANMQTANLDETQDDVIGEMKKMLKPKLMVNPTHPLVIYAANECEDNPEKSKKVLNHLLNWSMASAGLIDDTKALLDHTNELLMEIIQEKEAPKTESVSDAEKLNNSN